MLYNRIFTVQYKLKNMYSSLKHGSYKRIVIESTTQSKLILYTYTEAQLAPTQTILPTLVRPVMGIIVTLQQLQKTIHLRYIVRVFCSVSVAYTQISRLKQSGQRILRYIKSS